MKTSKIMRGTAGQANRRSGHKEPSYRSWADLKRAIDQGSKQFWRRRHMEPPAGW